MNWIENNNRNGIVAQRQCIFHYMLCALPPPRLLASQFSMWHREARFIDFQRVTHSIFILNFSPLHAVRRRVLIASTTYIYEFCDERRHKCQNQENTNKPFFIDSILFESRNNDKINLMADAKVSKQFMVDKNKIINLCIVNKMIAFLAETPKESTRSTRKLTNRNFANFEG